MTLLQPKQWESKSALVAHLSGRESQTLALGQEAEAPRAYYSFSVAAEHGHVEVGVITAGLGMGPAAVLLDSERRLLVGHDTWITCIDIESLQVGSSKRLSGVFYQFLPVESDEEIVVLHELGVVRISAGGSLKWSVDSGVVERTTVDAHGDLILTVMDEPRLVVSLESGAKREEVPRG